MRLYARGFVGSAPQTDHLAETALQLPEILTCSGKNHEEIENHSQESLTRGVEESPCAQGHDTNPQDSYRALNLESELKTE